MSLFENEQVVNKVTDDTGKQKKIGRTLPNPQPVTQRPKRTCRKSVFTTSPYVNENRSKRTEGGPTKDPTAKTQITGQMKKAVNHLLI